MPNKTIYVRDEDLPIFERAAAISGSLSAAIAEALREWVEKAETNYIVSAQKDGETVQYKVKDQERAEEIARELRRGGYEVHITKRPKNT